MGTMASYRLERDLLGAHVVYPGHPVVLALLVTHVFPSLASAVAPTEHGWSAALGSNDVVGGGDMVTSAMGLLTSVANGTRTVEEAITWAEALWSDSQEGGHVNRVAPGQEQAEIAKPLLRERLSVWPLN